MTNKELWFDTLDKVCGKRNWGRTSGKDGKHKTLFLWFDGYHHQSMHDAELALIKLGGRTLDWKFERDIGKTCLFVLEPEFTKPCRKTACDCDKGKVWNNGDDSSGQYVPCSNCVAGLSA
jgi:hypothetical protein